MSYEYTRFGDKLLRREAESSDEWQDVPADDYQDAAIEVGIAERERKRNRDQPRRVSSRVIRSERNQRVAGELGLSADEMAERLAKPDDNRGTNTRLAEGHFDTLMKEIDLDPQEARERFNGEHWTKGQDN